MLERGAIRSRLGIAVLNSLQYSGHANLDKLIQIAGRDRQKLHPLQKRIRFILRFFQHTAVKLGQDPSLPKKRFCGSLLWLSIEAGWVHHLSVSTLLKRRQDESAMKVTWKRKAAGGFDARRAVAGGWKMTRFKEKHMNEQGLGQAPQSSELMAEDTALQLFQIAALMLGDEQEAVSLVEESVAKVETDPCAEGTLAYAEARTLLVHTAVQRMAGLYPEAFAVPAAQPADAACIETDDLGAAGLTGEQFSALVSGAGRAGLREWLERLAPALRAIFVLARGRWTRRRTDRREPSPERSDRRAGVAARPGWERVSPGSMLAGHLPDECAGLAPAGLKSGAWKSKAFATTPFEPTRKLASVVPSFLVATAQTRAFRIAGGPSF